MGLPPAQLTRFQQLPALQLKPGSVDGATLRTVGARRRILTWAGVVVAAALGAAFGSSIAARPAGACSCAPNKWRVRLLSVGSTDPNVSHQPYWPVEADLSGFDRTVFIWSLHYEPGVISRAGTHE
jgi:hypothetical protein